MNERRIRVIVNPSAHSGRAWKTLRAAGLVEARPEGTVVEWVESRSAAHLVELVAQAQEERFDALGLAGGDGTVFLALSALPHQNRVPLGFLPVGSGNDFARDCGAPRDLPGAFAALVGGTVRSVDVARSFPDNHRYCCIAAVGLDELALRIIYASWWPRSRALNIYAALRALAVYRPRAVEVEWEGGGFSGEVMFVAVTNTRSYGGGFQVSPRARIDDGRLDICIVKRTGRLRLIGKFPRILKGTHGDEPEVVLAQSPWVKLRADGEPLPVPLDAELGAAITPVELRCEPASLRVLVPTRSNS
jgi:diacylglycerol kinase (ATP)